MTTVVPIDLVGNEISAGDWIVQSYNLGRCAAMKIAYVTETIADGRFRAVTFDSEEGGEWVDDPVEKQWNRPVRNWVPDGKITWSRSKPYTVTYSDRSFVITKEQLPDGVLDFIERELGGDPMAKLPESV